MEPDSVEKPLSEVTDFAAFKARRAEIRESKPAPAAEEKAPTTPPASVKADSETAAVSETAETKPTQEEEKHKGDRSLEGRVKALRAKGEHDKADAILREAWLKDQRAETDREKARADKLDEELRQSRTRKPEPEQLRPVETPKPIAVAADPSDPEPQISDEKYQKEGGFVEFQKDLAKYTWRQESKAQQQRTAADAYKAKGEKLMVSGRTAHQDFEGVVSKVVISKAVIHDGIQRLDNFGDVLYKIGSDPAELARIQALDPQDQWFEIKLISRELAKAPAAAGAPPPESQPKPQAVTKAAPPPRVLGGGRDDGEVPTTSEAKTFEDFKRIRKQRRSA